MIEQKESRLERVVGRLTQTLDVSLKVNQCVISKLQIDLKNNKRVAVEYTRSAFNKMLNDVDFFNWPSSIQTSSIEKTLSKSRPNNRISKIFLF